MEIPSALLLDDPLDGSKILHGKPHLLVEAIPLDFLTGQV